MAPHTEHARVEGNHRSTRAKVRPCRRALYLIIAVNVDHPASCTERASFVSSRRLRQEFPDLVRHYWRAQRLWSGSCFAGSVGGAPLSIARQYIEQQNRPVQGTARPWRAFPRGPSPPP
ncbi:transposase [Rhodococcus ruber BKS 20-38]|uniref:Transposase n=1 Tax=Rhodococcus ruber BKS 20-38 TaxID=1278076 RepID=M2YYN0_9NOCA|nr:transposase [Rhodococcus ruber BKS 20-38]